MPGAKGKSGGRRDGAGRKPKAISERTPVAGRLSIRLAVHDASALEPVAQQHTMTIAELMASIASGETATVLLGDEERAWLIDWLETVEVDDPIYQHTPRVLAAQLRAAVERERRQDREEYPEP